MILVKIFTLKKVRMHNEIKPFHSMFKGHSSFIIKRILHEVTDDDFKKQPVESRNSIQWIYGHIITERCQIIRLTGSERELPFNKLFDQGAKLLSSDNYPEITEMHDEMKKVDRELLDRLESLDESQIRKESSYNFRIDDKSVLGGIAFLLAHEGYHVGQMSYVRCLLGYKGPFG